MEPADFLCFFILIFLLQKNANSSHGCAFKQKCSLNIYSFPSTVQIAVLVVVDRLQGETYCRSPEKYATTCFLLSVPVCICVCVYFHVWMHSLRCPGEGVSLKRWLQGPHTQIHTFLFFFTVMLRPSAFQEASPHAGICMNQCAQQTLSQFWHHSGIMSVQLCFDFRSKIDNCLWHLCFFFNYSFPKFTEVVKLLIRKHLISVNFPEEQSHWWIYNVSQW